MIMDGQAELSWGFGKRSELSHRFVSLMGLTYGSDRANHGLNPMGYGLGLTLSIQPIHPWQL
jgi:hypothetical protein